jgi:predicted phage-related endonuclease
MVEQNTEEMQAGVFKLRYKTVTSNRFDTAAFKKTHIDLYNRYTKQTTSHRFSVA